MSIIKFKKIILVSSVSAIAAFGLVACGDDDSSKKAVAAKSPVNDILPGAENPMDDGVMKDVKEEVGSAVNDAKEKAVADVKKKAKEELTKHMPQ